MLTCLIGKALTTSYSYYMCIINQDKMAGVPTFLMHKHSSIKFEIVGEQTATKYIQICWTD